MADYREGLKLLPDHMWGQIKNWIERGEPHPMSMGGFFFSILNNRLVQANTAADPMNRAALSAWADFLHQYTPEQCWGSEEKLYNWYDLKHPKS